MASRPVPADQPLEFAPVAWAATESLPRDVFSEPMPGWGTTEVKAFLAALPPGGVAIFAGYVGSLKPERASEQFPKRSLPLLLADADLQRSYEGQAAPNVPMYILRALVHRQQIEVRVYFGRQHATPEQRQLAQDQLFRLVVPMLSR